MRYLAILPLSALALLAGCASGDATATATSPEAAKAQQPPPPPPSDGYQPGSLPQDTKFTYWRKVPGTNLHEPYTTDRPLTKDEQQQLGIVPPAHEATK